MKQIGRTANVTKEMTDKIFEKDHKGIAIGDNVGVSVEVDAFTLYQKEEDKDGSEEFSLKFWDVEGNDWYAGSQVFIKSFMRMAKLRMDMDANLFLEPMKITIAQRKSGKTGRDYYDIEEAPSAQPSNKWKDMEW